MISNIGGENNIHANHLNIFIFSSLLLSSINGNLSELVGRLEPYFIASGSNKTFNAIIKDSEKRAIFFANWADTTNFPALYGSGVCLPSPDNTRRHLIYILDGVLYTRYVNTKNLNERPWTRYMPS